MVVVALVVPILLLARSIGRQAEAINDSLTESVHNTAALAELSTTNEAADVIVAGLERGRTGWGAEVQRSEDFRLPAARAPARRTAMGVGRSPTGSGARASGRGLQTVGRERQLAGRRWVCAAPRSVPDCVTR